VKLAIIDGLKRWNDFSGRSNRSQFWWFYLFLLVTPLISTLISLVFTQIFVMLNLSTLSFISIIFSFLYLLFVPALLAVQVRRMHDVGKSGWFILVPLYNFYLFVQPSFEKGRIPKWILAEKVALGFVAILVISTMAGLFAGNTDSLVGLVFWSIIYLLIRRKNKAHKQVQG
jgi:uncharacterized membrane protein YhaH (DUF805 family)